jgi:hypothetical protein
MDRRVKPGDDQGRRRRIRRKFAGNGAIMVLTA